MKAMSRDEYLRWCKERAFTCIETGNFRDAIASFCVDLTKHRDTHDLVFVVIPQSRDIERNSSVAVRKFIEKWQEGILLADKDKPHRCPVCWAVPNACRKDGNAVTNKIYSCDACGTQFQKREAANE